MKKSLFAVAMFVFLAALSVVVPAYILATGTATLLPFAQFGAALVGLGGAGLFGFGAAMIWRADRRADITAHQSMVKTRTLLAGIPLWRKAFVVLRTVLQVALLLAIGQPLFAAFALVGLVGVLAHRGMLQAYFDRLPASGRNYSVKTAQGNDGKLYASGFGRDERPDI